MHSKVSSEWLPSYIKAKQSVLEIFKMARYFPAISHIIVRSLIKFQMQIMGEFLGDFGQVTAMFLNTEVVRGAGWCLLA